MDDLSTLAELFDKLRILKGPIGWVALTTFAVIRLYRLPEWQPSLPEKARWENLPVPAKYVIIATLAGIGAALAAAANGLSLSETVAAGLMAALGAILTNKLTKPQTVPVVVVAPVAEVAPLPPRVTL